jgi:hypothetical protein
MVALFAMEPPVSLDAEDIRNEKVEYFISSCFLPFSGRVIAKIRTALESFEGHCMIYINSKILITSF